LVYFPLFWYVAARKIWQPWVFRDIVLTALDFNNLSMSCRLIGLAFGSLQRGWLDRIPLRVARLLILSNTISRVTRWVCEIAQNVAQPIFLIHNFKRGKSSPQNWAISVIFKKKLPKESNRPMAIIRPIWGRCYDHNFLQFSTIFGEKIGVFLKNQCYDQNFA
jgi:hypothetical protein